LSLAQAVRLAVVVKWHAHLLMLRDMSTSWLRACASPQSPVSVTSERGSGLRTAAAPATQAGARQEAATAARLTIASRYCADRPDTNENGCV
jgi:hypothetical protein